MFNKRNRAICLAYKDGYRATMNGDVISPHGNRKLKLYHGEGYMVFTYTFRKSTKESTKRTNIQVHRFVAYQKFGESIFDRKIQVRHLNNNSMDNSMDNIEIGTQSKNIFDLPESARIKKARQAALVQRKLSIEEARKLIHDRKCGLSYLSLSIKYNIAKSTAYYVVNKHTYYDA